MTASTCPASPALQRKLMQALTTCTACQPQLEYFQGLAGSCPELQQTISDVELMLETLHKIATVGLVGANVPPADQTA